MQDVKKLAGQERQEMGSRKSSQRADPSIAWRTQLSPQLPPTSAYLKAPLPGPALAGRVPFSLLSFPSR